MPLGVAHSIAELGTFPTNITSYWHPRLPLSSMNQVPTTSEYDTTRSRFVQVRSIRGLEICEFSFVDRRCRRKRPRPDFQNTVKSAAPSRAKRRWSLIFGSDPGNPASGTEEMLRLPSWVARPWCFVTARHRHDTYRPLFHTFAAMSWSRGALR